MFLDVSQIVTNLQEQAWVLQDVWKVSLLRLQWVDPPAWLAKPSALPTYGASAKSPLKRGLLTKSLDLRVPTRDTPTQLTCRGIPVLSFFYAGVPPA